MKLLERAKGLNTLLLVQVRHARYPRYRSVDPQANNPLEIPVSWVA